MNWIIGIVCFVADVWIVAYILHVCPDWAEMPMIVTGIVLALATSAIPVFWEPNHKPTDKGEK